MGYENHRGSLFFPEPEESRQGYTAAGCYLQARHHFAAASVSSDIYRRSQFFAAAIATEPVFQAAKPQLLFERPTNKLGWDVFPGGQHFVVVQVREKPTQIRIVQNWTEELKLIVPSEPSLQ